MRCVKRDHSESPRATGPFPPSSRPLPHQAGSDQDNTVSVTGVYDCGGCLTKDPAPGESGDCWGVSGPLSCPLRRNKQLEGEGGETGALWGLRVTAAFVVFVCPHLFGRAVATWTSPLWNLTAVEAIKSPRSGSQQLGFESRVHHLLPIQLQASFLTFPNFSQVGNSTSGPTFGRLACANYSHAATLFFPAQPPLPLGLLCD